MLTVEDGSGSATADTFVDLATADDYWTKRGNAAWIAAIAEGIAGTAKREAALRQAFDYLGYVYRFPGQPRIVGQRGAWPRTGVPSGRDVFPSDAIPTQIVDAQLLLAVEALGRDLLTKPEPTRVLVEESKGVRGITKTQKFQVGGVDTNTGLLRFPLVDTFLQGLVLRTGNSSIGTVPLVRG